MTFPRPTLILLSAAVVTICTGIFALKPPRLDREKSAPLATHLASEIAPSSPQERHEAVRRSAESDWSALRDRLDAMAPGLADIRTQREAARLVARWMTLDRPAPLAWLATHRGDARFDPVAASAGQALVAEGEYAEAQRLAETITDSAVREWLHREAWSVAYERRLVREEDVHRSGLPPAVAASIVSGSHRD